MTTEIPDGLVSYLAAMDRHRAREVDAALKARTPDELILMKEAAVMGYVQGMQAGRDVPIPKDLALLRMVVGACLAMPDLYPAISAHESAPESPEDTRDRVYEIPDEDVTKASEDTREETGR